ncbi:sigma-54 interaction domain-containing protein [Paenibacillus radicibacter]|uniref:sigma-54 interaction domain-containing protein n=1 Tax=Paenibacillus radicibacter TaxID=2972488 RepID=UPI002158C809|nr:sigma 54-interacting transcriptional regulator [Paenibacillus radicibacter]
MDPNRPKWSSQFEWILSMINVGVHMVDIHGATVYYNETMANIDGLSLKQVLGQNILELFPSLTNETSTLHLVLQKSTPITDQLQTYVNLQGKHITSINSTYPLFENDVMIGAVEIARDISNVMSMYDQILDLNKQLVASKQKNKSKVGSADYHFSDIIGQDSNFLKAISLAKKAARTPSPVLICGTTGTGKELVAQSIHNASSRSSHPFLAQNCAAVPKELMEALLFGTNRGAFTGSVDRQGIFEQANGGTLFFDELSSLDLGLQAKLLRVLQDGKIRRIGGTTEQQVNVRVIAAMNMDPTEAVEKGILRSDLLFRLNVVQIELPELAKRRSDIPSLVEHFVQSCNERFGTHVRGLTENAIARLYHFHWPGNIRQLSHAIESAFNMMDMGCDLIEENHLPAFLFENNPPARVTPKRLVPDSITQSPMQTNLQELLDQVERDTIRHMFEACHGNISRTAEALGIKRQSLQYKLTKYEIRHT